MRSFTWHAVAVVALAASLVACDSGNTPTPTTPTPTGTQITETFTGTLTAGTSQVHSFNVGVGVVDATLNSLSPVSTTAIGSSYGFWDGLSCSPITPTVVESSSMVLGMTLVGTAMKSAAICLKVYDVGNIPAGTTYTYVYTVTHY